MPEISKFYGIVISMYPNDHNPPHFHVKYEEYRAIVEIKTGLIIGEMPRRALNIVFEWLDVRKDELMDNWEKLQNGESANKVKPLD